MITRWLVRLVVVLSAQSLPGFGRCRVRRLVELSPGDPQAAQLLERLQRPP